MRIVSLLPSATEIICAIGLESSLVGVTHECDYPPTVRGLPIVTKTIIPKGATSLEIDLLVRNRLETQAALYSLDAEMLTTLKPDLLVTQALCDVCAVSDEEVRTVACSLPGNPKVINLEPMCLEEVFETMLAVGSVAGVEDDAKLAVKALRSRAEAVTARSRHVARTERVAVLEWIDPPFTCGHWTPELVEMAGGVERVGQKGAASRTMDWNKLLEWQPEFLLIACCGFDLERTRQDLPLLARMPGWRQIPAVMEGEVYMVNGSDYFSRPGPRLVDSLEILAHALHPLVHPLPPGLEAAERVAI